MSNVKDVKVKPVVVMLDGDNYNLCYDLNAFAELEDKYGTVEEALKAMEKGNFKAIRTFIWAGLQRDHEELTEKNVGALITPGDLESLAASIGEALEAAAPNTGSKKAPNVVAAR